MKVQKKSRIPWKYVLALVKPSGSPTLNSNSNIPATLDLTQSLEHFQQTIALALALGDVSKWDGRELCSREQQIRQAALILAGQCTALLLHNLAESSEAQTTAAKQTQGWRSPTSTGDGKRRVQVLTLGNVVVSLWLPYVVERSKNPSPNQGGKRRKSQGQGFYPFLRWLSMEEHLTPLVWSTLAQYGMLSSSFAAARDTLKAWGIAVSLKRLERLTYRFGQLGLFRRQERVNQLQYGTLPVTPVFKEQRVVISVDGGRTRIRRPKKGKPRQTTNRHGYYRDWQEPKLLTIYAVDEQGKRVNTAEIPLTNDGTFGLVEPFMQLLEMHLVRLGIHQAKQVLLLADGADWIWLRIPTLLKRLGCPAESILELLDFYHATEHLQQVALSAFTDTTTSQTWFKKARSDLKHGRVSDLLNRMQALVKEVSGERKNLIAGQVAYFSKFEQLSRLKYSQVAAMKLPIGSGAVESLIRQVVNLRLKGTGKFWLLENAEIMLHARCQWAAGAWSSFCDSILTAYLYPV